MISHRIYDRLELPIDTEINWHINGYDNNTNVILKEAEPIECCHDVSVNIGGVEVKLPVFMVKHYSTDIILSQPWKHPVWVTFINKDDESYTCIIKSQDGCRIVKFYMMKANHE